MSFLNEDSEEVDPKLDEQKLNDTLDLIIASATKFCAALIGFKPFPYQVRMLEDRSKLIVCCAGRQVGKTLVVAAKALWFAFTHPHTVTIIVAATQRQSMAMFEKLMEHLEDSELLSDSITRKTKTQVWFSNRSKISALPCGRTGKTIRGPAAHLAIVDEAAFVPEQVILEAMMPMMATTDGTMIMMSTPYDRKHFFYQAFNSRLWSKYHFKTQDNPLVKKEFMEHQLEIMSERRYMQEYMAEFVDDEGTYFPMALLRPCIHVCDSSEKCDYCEILSLKVPSSGELYAGYDPGGMTDPAAFVVVEKMPRSNPGQNENSPKRALRVVLMRTFAAKKDEKNSAGEVYTRFTSEIAELHKKLHFQKLIVDSTGIGSPIVEHCEELKLPVTGMNMSGRNQEEIFSNLKILFEETRLELPNDMEVLSSLNCITTERNRIGALLFDHARGSHDDLAYALALALWGARMPGRKSVIFLRPDQDSKDDLRSPGERWGFTSGY